MMIIIIIIYYYYHLLLFLFSIIMIWYQWYVYIIVSIKSHFHAIFTMSFMSHVRVTPPRASRAPPNAASWLRRCWALRMVGWSWAAKWWEMFMEIGWKLDGKNDPCWILRYLGWMDYFHIESGWSKSEEMGTALGLAATRVSLRAQLTPRQLLSSSLRWIRSQWSQILSSSERCHQCRRMQVKVVKHVFFS